MNWSTPEILAKSLGRTLSRNVRRYPKSAKLRKHNCWVADVSQWCGTIQKAISSHTPALHFGFLYIGFTQPKWGRGFRAQGGDPVLEAHLYLLGRVYCLCLLYKPFFMDACDDRINTKPCFRQEWIVALRQCNADMLEAAGSWASHTGTLRILWFTVASL